MVAKQFFIYGDGMKDIGKGAHFMKHSHGRSVVCPFDKFLHEGSILTGRRAVLSFILQKSIFFNFVHYGTRFYDKYITLDHGK